MQDLWWVEASKYNVLPLDWRGVERFNSELMGRPSISGNRKTFTYYSGQIGLTNEAAPRILNRSWTLSADINIPEKGAEGMIVTDGGLEGGYGLYVQDGKIIFVYNYLDVERYTIKSETTLPKRKVDIKIDLAYKGAAGEMGKGTTVTMMVNGTKVGGGEIPKTIPNQISIGEGMDVGMDVGSPVDFNYKMPFKFTGTIDRVTIDLK